MIDFELLRCPNCASTKLYVEKYSEEIVCQSCEVHYPFLFGRPVLLRPDNDVFCLDDYRSVNTPLSSPQKNRYFRKLIPKASINLASHEVLSMVREALQKKTKATILVVGGGDQRRWLDKSLGASDFVQVVYSDIDIGADVDLFCDGHDLPFVDGLFDAVITTAVLEHVLYPERVAAEIIRVLKIGGLLYSELPFMQQVHEGAYDFTRYTLSGHRRLFNGVSEIKSGMVAGPGTALVWAIENFIISFLPQTLSRSVSKVILRLAFGWIKYFDLLLKNSPAAMDGASCTYILGKKIEGRISDIDIISRYFGAKHISHN